MSLRIESARSEDLFVGTAEAPRQVVRVTLSGDSGPVRVGLSFGSVRATAEEIIVTLDGRGPAIAEVPFRTDAAPGTVLPARVVATADNGAQVRQPLEVTVAEPGWTMYMVSHFHYDPVWWNTQAAYTATWDVHDEPGVELRGFNNRGHTGFSLVRAHLELARRDPEYTFVLAELDYLKPYWDAVPSDRALLRDLLRSGRVEMMGGTYNEPNTNLTSAESTARNFVQGVGFQRDVLGGDPATAWQLDVFGHDPQFAGMAADAGITSSAWARGPFHQWGPMMRVGDDRNPREATVMQFPSEFTWLSPSGRGVLTHYMPNHYSAGWRLESSPTLEEAFERAYQLFQGLRPVALTRNVLLPVGGDFTPPNKWLMALHRAWRERYVWPRFVCGLPRDFFAAVREEMATTGVTAPPQTRDMNPVYTGKDVSYVDTKQANRAAEQLLVEAETWASLARILTGRRYEDEAFDKAWRQLTYGAHHDAVTGSESDQVYIDLLTGWREAYDLARVARDDATAAIASDVATAEPAMVLFNSLNVDRADMVSVPSKGLVPADERGQPLPCVVSDGQLTFRSPQVPGVGHLAVPLVPGEAPNWQPADGQAISNEHYRLRVDPARGGCVESLVEVNGTRELIAADRVGNELLVYEEYPQHPDFGEGPWHLLPKGPPVGSADGSAAVRREVSPAGERLIVDGSVAGIRYTQVLTLWRGADRLDCATTIHEYAGADRLIRVRWPCPVPGGLPVSEVGNAVIGRGFGLIDVDTAEAPWTLDNPACNWFGLGSTARLRLTDVVGKRIAGERAVGIAELVFTDWDAAGRLGGDLATALARRGVTATSAIADGSRYGNLDVDSNLPDVRIAVGTSGFTEEVFARAAQGERLRAQLAAALAETGRARVLVPASKPLADVWQPGADLTDPDLLPVLVIAGVDADALADEVDAVIADLSDGVVEVRQSIVDDVLTEPLDDRTVALFNRGLPGFAVDASGALHLSLLRSCTGWPSGVWIDPPKRTAPDGSPFQLMHWSHTFEYAFASGAGDWREQHLVSRAAGYNRPLHPVVVPGGGSGSHPGTARLLEVGPADASGDSRDQVMVTAVKAAGNPLSRGSDTAADPAQGLTVRCYETTGRPTRVRVTGPVRFDGADVTDLLEQPVAPAELVDAGPDAMSGATGPVSGSATADVAGAGILTLTARPAGASTVGPSGDATPATGASGDSAPAAGTGPAPPVYTRYWLHNTGPAPLGNQPVSVFVSPERLVAGDGPATVSVTVSSELTDVRSATRVEFVAPDGWDVEPRERDVDLGPGGFSMFDATVRPAPDATPGTYFLAARIRHAGLEYEDVVTVQVPGERPAGLVVSLGRDALTVPAGGRIVLPVRLHNGSCSEIRGELQAVSPYGSWDFVRPGVQGFAVPAGQVGQASVEVAPPPYASEGTSWLLVKANWFGRIGYSPTIPIRVTRT